MGGTGRCLRACRPQLATHATWCSQAGRRSCLRRPAGAHQPNTLNGERGGSRFLKSVAGARCARARAQCARARARVRARAPIFEYVPECQVRASPPKNIQFLQNLCEFSWKSLVFVENCKFLEISSPNNKKQYFQPQKSHIFRLASSCGTSHEGGCSCQCLR